MFNTTQYLNTECGKKALQKIEKEFGQSINILENPQNHIVGRTNELKQLTYIMHRRNTPIALLQGDAGTGKTAIVYEWLLLEHEKNRHYYGFKLNLGTLSAYGRDSMQQKLERVLPALRDFQKSMQTIDKDAKALLLIDEFHMIVSIFGKGSKIGGDLLKQSLTENPICVIGCTTRKEYDAYIAPDPPLARRLKNIEINELTPDETYLVLKNWISQQNAEIISKDTLKYIIKVNSLYRKQYSEPSKSIDVLETGLSISETDSVPIDKSMIKSIFINQYNIDLSFKVNPKNVMQVIIKRVMGQPLALYTIDRVVKRISFGFQNANRPKATILFAGPTGVGKSEMAKAFCAGIYGSESKLCRMDMHNFSLPTAEPEFRRELGNAITHDPSSVILLDEIEKAHSGVLKTLLPVLDEGRLVFESKGNDGYEVSNEVSLKDSIIIATTNSSAEVFSIVNKYGRYSRLVSQDAINKVTDGLRNEWNNERPIIIKALDSSDFPPELLGRFQDVVPFHALNEATLITIADSKVRSICNNLKKKKGVIVNLPKDRDFGDTGYHYKTNEIALFIAIDKLQTDDSDSGGARDVDRVVQDEFLAPILDFLFNNPKTNDVDVRVEGASFQNPRERSIGKVVVKENVQFKLKKNIKTSKSFPTIHREFEGSGTNRYEYIK